MIKRGAENKSGQKTRSRYFPRLAAFFCMNLIVISVALSWMYNALAKFESSTPENSVRRYFESVAARDFERIREESGFSPSGWNSWENYDEYIYNLFQGVPQDIEYRRTASNEPDGALIYAVYIADEKVGILRVHEGQSEDGSSSVMAPVEYLPGYTLTGPEHVVFLVNGVELGDEYLLEIRGNEFFADLPEGYDCPAEKTYAVTELMSEPVFDIRGTDEGAECELSVDRELREVTASVVVGEEQRAAFAASMEAAAKRYAQYISRDATFTQLASHLLYGTELYNRMLYFDNQWYANHVSHAFRDIAVSELVSTSSGSFTGRIDFVFQVSNGVETFEFPSTYYMSFIHSGGKWLLVELQVE